MSKIGNQPIMVPKSVAVEINHQKITVKGKEGEMTIFVPPVIKLSQESNQLLVSRLADDKKARSLHGLYRQLIANAIQGVEKPWEKKLEIVGTGYQVKLEGEDLIFKIGYSHPVVFKKVAGVRFRVDNNRTVTVFGVDKQLVGEVAYQIRMIKKPDSYKGKGIRYKDEIIKLKPSKKVKAAGEATAGP